MCKEGAEAGWITLPTKNRAVACHREVTYVTWVSHGEYQPRRPCRGRHSNLRCPHTLRTVVLGSWRLADLLEIIVNGQPRQVAPGSTVTDLLRELGMDDRPVAVERNRDVVPRAQHADCRLATGDRLELVTFVGGG